MQQEAVATLRCPHCTGPLGIEGASGAGGALRCAEGHSFDIARQGYVSLLPGDAHTGTADTAPMVAARERFLARGHYAPIADAVADAASRAAAGVHGVIVEVGAGTGYHLAHTLDALPDRTGLALDISKHAARRAARAHPRMAAIVCDAWRALPLAPGVAAVVLDVFAPRNAAEMARVLAPGGALVVVTPTDRHLRELVAGGGMLAVDERKEERLAATLGERFDTATADERVIEYTVAMTAGDAEAAVAMGPGAHHRREEADSDATPAAVPASREVTVSVRLGIYRVRDR